MYEHWLKRGFRANKSISKKLVTNTDQAIECYFKKHYEQKEKCKETKWVSEPWFIRGLKAKKMHLEAFAVP